MSDSLPTFETERSLRHVSFLWSQASDTKDWDLLRSICAPQIKLIYRGLAEGTPDEVRERDDYVDKFAKGHLGDERLHTQHFLGNVVFTMIDDKIAKGQWQCRARHLRDLKTGEVVEWSVGSYLNHFYERDQATKEWKLAGVEPHSIVWQVGKWADVIGDFE